ncbi:hypothetical protein [Halostella salina]|uniref:hypothetical protein n=1 Tax=Halostella salina TaxID=1547897 RepID=UPI000EF788D9|nr:hypothetical protein [Halostella salina]
MNPDDLARELTGTVAGGLGVDPDYARGSVPCARCHRNDAAVDRDEGDGLLEAGDEVTVAFRRYEGHTWEPVGVYCRDHGVDAVADAMPTLAEDQAVVAAVLEPTGYRDPLDGHHPNALSLGGVAVLDASPAGEGY